MAQLATWCIATLGSGGDVSLLLSHSTLKAIPVLERAALWSASLVVNSIHQWSRLSGELCPSAPKQGVARRPNPPVVRASFLSTSMDVDGNRLNFQIWDTAGGCFFIVDRRVTTRVTAPSLCFVEQDRRDTAA